MSAVQILIADDHELFRRTARSFIESHPNWQVCGEAGDGIEAIEKAKRLRPQSHPDGHQHASHGRIGGDTNYSP